MKLAFIATLANCRVRLRLLAMIRSLRATGCELPVRVIPYSDGDEFELPAGCTWWREDPVVDWLAAEKAHPVMRKYQCLLAENYQFADADVVFLRNPAAVLERAEGFVTSCGHWRDPGHTVTAEAEGILSAQSNLWPRAVFNSGQFASDRALFADAPALQARARQPSFERTVLRFPFHEQPGLNLLVLTSGVPVQNLTLCPGQMESTWAGDYDDADYRRTWTSPERTPYLIHWAGTAMGDGRPIHELFLNHLTQEEREQFARIATMPMTRLGRLTGGLRRVKRSVGAAWRELRGGH